VSDRKGNKPIKVALLGASFDTCNMGVSALAETSIKCILNRWPEAEVILLGESRFVGEHHLVIKDRVLSIRRVPVRFGKNILATNHFFMLSCYAFLLKLFRLRRFRDFLVKHNSYLRFLLQTDHFVGITGGDSFSDIYGMRRFMLGFLKKLLPIMFGKDLILLPQTYGPFKKNLTKFFARYILKHSNALYSRDRAGTEYVRRLLNDEATEGKIRFVPDLAFVLDARKPPRIDIGSFFELRTDKSVVVGLNISGLLYYGGYTRDNMFGLKEDYSQTICRIIDFLMAKKDVLVLLVPHVFPPVESAEVGVVENDVAACFNIYKTFSEKYSNRVFMVCGRYDQSEIKYIIGLCNFFLGSRMHSCIAALSQNIPTVGLAYSKKFFGVFDSIGVGDLVIDLRTNNKNNIMAHINKAFSECEAIANKLSQTVPKAQEEILKIFRPEL